MILSSLNYEENKEYGGEGSIMKSQDTQMR